MNILAVAVDVGATKISVAEARGSTLHGTAVVPTTNDPHDDIALAVRKLMSMRTRNVSGFPLIGCSFAGSVDEAGVVLAWPGRPSWCGFPLRATLARLLGRGGARVTIEDDGYAAAVGESTRMRDRLKPDALLLVLGTGIGGAQMIGGSPRRPLSPDALTLGHLPAVGIERVCACGRVGCLQLSLASLPSAPPYDLWVEGRAACATLAAIALAFGLPEVVLTGGLLQRQDLAAQLILWFQASGLQVTLSYEPATSALLGAAILACR